MAHSSRRERFLEERLKALERRLRRVQFAGLTGLLVAGSLALMGQRGSGGRNAVFASVEADLVVAKEIAVRQSGSAGAGVGITSLNGPKIHLYDSNPAPRMRLALVTGGLPEIVFLDGSGTVTFQLPPPTPSGGP